MAKYSEHPGAEASRMTLAARMKSYEAANDIRLEPGAPAILRLDGHGFSKFTSHFARPFDTRIHNAMVAACGDLLGHFPAATLAYTQSDEMTVVFPTGVGIFNDRVQKIVGLAAAFASVRFNLRLAAALDEQPHPPVRRAADILGTAYFDGRLFAVPDAAEALNCLLWRCRGDAVRNGVSAFARKLFSDAELHGKNTGQVVSMMLEEKGVVYRDAVPSWAPEGSLVKRELYEVEGLNKATGEAELATRTRIKVADRGITAFSDENLKLVVDRYW